MWWFAVVLSGFRPYGAFADYMIDLRGTVH